MPRVLGEGMLAKLKSWAARAAGNETAPAADGGALRDATALLLVEAASLDGDFSADEEAQIRALLADHFAIPAPEADRLLAGARARHGETVELYGMTRTIKDRMAPEDRAQVLEMLWRVAYADGDLHDFEANLARRVAGLLHVNDRDSGAARKRALRRLEQNGKPA